MLNFRFFDSNNEAVTPGAVLALTMRTDENVPADSVSAVFEPRENKELSRVEILDEETMIFSGIVDEQERILTEKGDFLRISARSKAALLLDNECCPATYRHPTAGLLAEKHLLPLGIEVQGDLDTAFFGEFVITKGMSCYSMIKRFCQSCFKKAPYVTPDGTLLLGGPEESGAAVFSNRREGIAFSRFQETRKRCEEISRVRVKLEQDSGYLNSVDNPDAIARGILRERYLNAALTDTPMPLADRMIENAARKSYEIKLTVGERLTGLLGAGAEVDVKEETLTGLYVSALCYRLSAREETTEITLKRRES